MRAAQHGGVRHPLQADVRDEARRPRQAGGGRDARVRVADDGELLAVCVLRRGVVLDERPALLVATLHLDLRAHEAGHVRRSPPLAPRRARWPGRRRSGTGCRSCRRGSRRRSDAVSARRSATAESSCPGVQNPHWKASSAVKAARRRSSSSPSPSTVRTSAPSQATARVRHESTARPSTSTVQLPQVPSPHATLVPVSAASVRMTSARGRCGSTSSSCGRSLMVSRSCISGYGTNFVPPLDIHRAPGAA